jgi:crotonobetainyl-CoA:carnitine CoA-transferase CaiB-like acyl-CoA transferase
MLADHGADVIKIESLAGDDMRRSGTKRTDDLGPIFLQNNRNKRSLAIDLKQRDAAAILERLVGWCDVLITNIRPQALARLALDYERVRALRPQVVYVSCTGFGEDGPYAGKPAFDGIIQAMTGLPMAMKSEVTGLPHMVPCTFADRYTATYTAFCVSTALAAAARTGRGQKIEVPMFEVMAQLVLMDHLDGALYQPPLGEPGYARLLDTDRVYYATADGFLCATLNTDRQWMRLLDAIGRPELKTDPAFASLDARARNIKRLEAFLREVFAGDTTAHWLALLESIEVPATRPLTFADLVHDPHLAATGFFIDVEQPGSGTLRMPGFPAKWSATPPGLRRPAPRLGEHTAEILGELGFGAAEIDAFRNDAVVA